MILSAAITAVRERLDEADSAGWSDVEIRRWINEGVTDVARKTETVQTTTTIDVDAGDADHTLPSNVLRVYRATYTEDGNDHIYPLEYVDFNAADSIWWTDQAITEARPRMFTMWGYPPTLSAKLYPVPSVAGTLTVYYYSAPTPLSTSGMSDASSLVVPEAYIDLVLDYATYLALRRDRDPRWKEFKQTYDENLSMMIDMTRRWSDQAGTVSRAGTGLPNWLVGEDW
jgi:hypothetical protein